MDGTLPAFLMIFHDLPIIEDGDFPVQVK